jgi:S-adenosylmethionine:tRNA ribosyltransferase-isomerase
VLETLVDDQGRFVAGEGETGIFIRPPHVVRGADRLITNFHLPRSTLLMLVSAFAGYELARLAYDIAIAREYRFFSYGDAMCVI